nr:lamin tail domain-containing protein [Polyangiaceae bacterium]
LVACGGADPESGAGGSGGCSTNAHIVINELVPNPPSSDNGKEWLELYNPTCSAVSIAGWVIESATSTFAPTFTLPNGASIPSLGYVVIGGADVTFADFKKTTALNMGNASGSADAVRLVNAQSAVIDTVIYGSPNSDAFKDDTGAVATSLAPTPTSSQALARIPNGSDTNQCGADFIATHNLTPKAVNAP